MTISAFFHIYLSFTAYILSLLIFFCLALIIIGKIILVAFTTKFIYNIVANATTLFKIYSKSYSIGWMNNLNTSFYKEEQ